MLTGPSLPSGHRLAAETWRTLPSAARVLGAAKARGFESILNITVDDIDYLEQAIENGILAQPIDEVRANPPHGFNCVVSLPVEGIHDKCGRTGIVRTIWELPEPGTSPRLVSAFVKP